MNRDTYTHIHTHVAVISIDNVIPFKKKKNQRAGYASQTRSSLSTDRLGSASLRFFSSPDRRQVS